MPYFLWCETQTIWGKKVKCLWVCFNSVIVYILTRTPILLFMFKIIKLSSINYSEENNISILLYNNMLIHFQWYLYIFVIYVK